MLLLSNLSDLVSKNLLRNLALVALFFVVAIAGTVSGVLFAYADDLPEISALDDYRPNTITRLLAKDGSLAGDFATQRRVVISYDQMGPTLRNAIIATEDADFEQHFGLSANRILVTIVRDAITGERKGASTITQQLARDLFLRQYMRDGGVYARTGLSGVERKIKEWLVALQIERRYTKREIFSFYANQIYLGHGAYGVEAASHLYFDKSASQLAPEEAATIAGLIQSPERLSPFVDRKRSQQRRNRVLQRMREEGYLTKDQEEAAGRKPLQTQGDPTPERSVAPYFVEEIRKGLEQKYGAKALYEAGLTVQTTLDPELQAIANVALDRGLRRLDKVHTRFRTPARNILAEGHRLDRFTADRWNQPVREDDIVPAVVMDASGRIRIGATQLVLPRAAFAWTGKASMAELVKPGDLVEVRVTKMAGGVPKEATLEQPPIVEGGLVAIDNRTGEIRAMVGGYSFTRSKFNRATQAHRQMGSAFKPVIYTAAIDHGYTPTTIVVDEPISYEAGPNQPLYQPLNYDRKYEGAITLRRAIEDSRNIPAVKTIHDIGPEVVVDYAKRFGFPEHFEPYLSLALGAMETTVLESTSAYSAFPNQGVRMAPYSVVRVSDREGNVLEENHPQPHEAIRADTAFVMTHLLEGVVLRGTAAAAASLKWPLAGKTGTMDEYTDAWFIGFDPNMTLGVWIGYDEKKPLGRNETGAAAALPVWMEVMRWYIDHRADRKNPPQFEPPANVVFATLDNGINEAFINGTQPGAVQPGAPVPASQPPSP